MPPRFVLTRGCAGTATLVGNNGQSAQAHWDRPSDPVKERANPKHNGLSSCVTCKSSFSGSMLQKEDDTSSAETSVQTDMVTPLLVDALAIPRDFHAKARVKVVTFDSFTMTMTMHATACATDKPTVFLAESKSIDTWTFLTDWHYNLHLQPPACHVWANHICAFTSGWKCPQLETVSTKNLNGITDSQI